MALRSITSRDNPQYKEIRQLTESAQARRKAGSSILDGVHLCATWLHLRGLPQLCIVGESAMLQGEVAEVVYRCDSEGARVISLSDALFHPLSQVENGVNLLFVVATPVALSPSTLSQDAVLLDQIQDPGNLGSIMRSAAAAGIKQIYCSTGTTQVWSPKVLRAGMGAHFLLDVFEHVDLETLVGSATIPVIATSSHTDTALYDLDLKQPVAWLLGHEGQGVAATLLDAASHRIAIPHLGEVESLNVAAAAAVCFFEQVRQKHNN